MRLLVLSFFILLPLLSFSQSLLDKKISVVIHDEPLGKVLIEIGKLAQVNFSYDSRLIPIDKIVTVKAVNKELKDLVANLIQDASIEILIIDNQVILKKKNEVSTSIPKPLQHVSRSQSLTPIGFELTAPDSIPLLSIYITPSLIESIQQNIISSRWSIEASYTSLFFNENLSGPNSNLIKESESPKPSTALSVRINYTLGNWLLQSGLQYSIYSKNSRYNFNRTDRVILDQGHYSDPFVKDSIYFVLHNTDTTWFVNYDSTWMNQWDTIVTNFQVKNTEGNQMHFIQIPLILGYAFYVNQWTICPKIGVVAGILSKRTGTTINNSVTLVSLKEIPYNPVMLFMYSGLQLHFKLNRRLSVFQETAYTRNISRVYQSHYNLHQSLNTLGVSLGLNYILN